MYGYIGKILEVNLSTLKVSIKKPDENFLKKFIGGVGLAAKILWDETVDTTEPLSDENPLIFMTGPLVGTPIPGSSRYIVSSISPLTNIWGEAHAGGSFGDELKRSGYDGLIINGKSEVPVYIWIHDEDVEILNANFVWGKDIYETEALIKHKTDKKASIATIGQAGEKLVKFAAIVNDGRDGRVAARCGMGTVMGYKKLKAIAVKGSMEIKLYDKKNFNKVASEIYRRIPKESPDKKAERFVQAFRNIIDAGGAPFKNWKIGKFSRAYELPDELRKTSAYFCRHCPSSCAESRVNEDGERHMVYEAWAPMGTQCLITDAEMLQEAYSLCNRYGLDSISTGAVIAFAMELFEKGIITLNHTDGIDLTWGNSKALIETIKKIVEGDKFGAMLSGGVKSLANRLGGLSKEYSLHVKGLEFPAHDPRASCARALHYATSNIGPAHFAEGGCIGASLEDYYKHIHFTCPEFGVTEKLNRFDPTNKAEVVAHSQDFGCVIDSLVVCYFPVMYFNITPSYFMELLNFATGWDFDIEEFMKTGERIFNLKRMFNVRRGISRKDDRLPPRMLTYKLVEGGTFGFLPPLDPMLCEYYAYRGWSEEGIPTRKKLEELELTECLAYAVA